MILRNPFSRLVVLLVMGGLLLAPLPPFVSTVNALSIDQEVTLGKQFLAEIRRHEELLEDDDADGYLNDLGQYLLKSIKIKPFPFHFHIIKDDTLNAFAAPGGQIFFYSGLIEIMDNCDMLAGVMAHEIGHSTARHLSNRVDQSKKIGLATMAGILAGIFVGGVAANALITGSMAAGIQAQLHYSREDERQADQLGFRYATAAGFEPSALTAALKKISQGNWTNTAETPPYLLTHPTGPERMANLDSMALNFKPHSPTDQTRHFRELFALFKTVVRAQCLDSYDAEKFFQKKLKQNPAGILPNLGLGIVYKNRSEFAAAEDHLRTALRGAPQSVPILRTLGSVYQLQGKDHDAIAVLKQALSLKHDDPEALFKLAVSYEDLEQYEEAIKILRRLTSFTPTKKEVYYHLGIAYGRLNQLALAHLHFGRYFTASGEKEKAIFHFKKAKDLAQGDPALLKEIEKAMPAPHKKN
jgi:predicted Zn-dependent protease